MDRSLKRKVVAGTVAAIAVGGAGAGIAATQLRSSPSEESQAIVNDAAKQLGVQPDQLSGALKKAIENQIDAAVAAGRLTKAQGDELKQRIESNNFPLFGPLPLGFGFRHFGFPHRGFPGLDAAASYLGLTDSQLDAKLDSGKTLAQVAKDQRKSVDGLVSALKADLKKKLDRAVSHGRITRAQEDQALEDADMRLKNLVNGKFIRPPRPERWFGHRDDFGTRPGPGLGFDGPPAA
jgi:gas vesicle protein